VLSWSCGDLLVTVLLGSCGDPIFVSVQVELNQSCPSRSSEGAVACRLRWEQG
jgi:hypothetical protein